MRMSSMSFRWMTHPARSSLESGWTSTRQVLDAMEPERRALFVMIVIEEMPTEEVAVLLDVPVGTVHSRMHAARKQFEDCVKRVNARYEHRSLR